ncbi:hypothetical protein EBZ38_00020 [bacterium]|nr:hypothetical protein [bacterium]
MKDTRPVHMGTFELQKKHTNAEIDKIKQDVIVHQRCLNSLYNRVNKTERMLSAIISISIGIAAVGLAILFQLIFV